ncbi:integrating conjugative element protein [Xenorhabdus beddingii]|uniref:Integrating conjugative element protein n=1 Tax=Xenorhabdus beddingii TaxID=40578 RepID=A0A1Y2SPZ7_9GAMM|nr:TIGR03756 family integrating conjugative element protein [Xenorhabdus beddingii]OTA19823.1 integrating conjugative element protein [Xenorhabdus beddingii]
MNACLPVRLASFPMVITLMAAFSPAVQASINTAQIIAGSVSPSCLSWRVSGICYWLFCTWHGCTVKTSVRVSHYLPEAVVSTYHAAGGNPWSEMAQVSQLSGGAENAVTGAFSHLSTGGGDHNVKISGQRSTRLRFKYADAIGHPAPTLMGGSIPGYSCRSVATPLMPYFLSTLDTVAWRSGLPESFYPEALIPGQRELGNMMAGNLWGNIYPRSGFVSQGDDDKASAVVAQRVADIITRAGQPHVYQALQGQRADGYWPPGPVTENSGTKNHRWQRLSPHLSSSCAVFPDGEHTSDVQGNQAYALWQPYSCCQRRGQRFLGSTTF